MIIREIQAKDNQAMAAIVRQVIVEMGAPTTGTAYEDKALDDLYTTYVENKGVYYVLEADGEVIGGAGIARLDGGEPRVCELQKMYFLPQARGKGMGKKLILQCFEKAKELGFTHCYIETMNSMLTAQELYKKVGFTALPAPLGATGHSSCQIWMLKTL